MKCPLSPNEILERISQVLDRKEFDYQGKIEGNTFEMRVKQYHSGFFWHSPSLIKGEVLPWVNGSIVKISFKWHLTTFTKLFYLFYYFGILALFRSLFKGSYSIPIAVLLFLILLYLFFLPLMVLFDPKKHFSTDVENLKKIFKAHDH